MKSALKEMMTSWRCQVLAVVGMAALLLLTGAPQEGAEDYGMLLVGTKMAGLALAGLDAWLLKRWMKVGRLDGLLRWIGDE